MTNKTHKFEKYPFIHPPEKTSVMEQETSEPLMRSILLCCSCLYLTSLAAPCQLWGAPKTNVILIMADDIDYECYGAYGGTSYKTPVLDRMARQGMRFDHAYSNPVCTPSRVKIMTGLTGR